MKKILRLIAPAFAMLALSSLAAQWQQYPVVSSPGLSDTFLIGTTTTNQQISAANYATWVLNRNTSGVLFTNTFAPGMQLIVVGTNANGQMIVIATNLPTGGDMLRAQNLADVANAATARDNIGADNASNLILGTLGQARLPAMVVTNNGNFSPGLLKAGAGGDEATNATPGVDYLTPSGSGAALTALNASQLTSGTVPQAALPSMVVTNLGSLSAGLLKKGAGQNEITNAIPGVDYITSLSSRSILTNAFTWYVATTGSDSNAGTNSGSPFLTIQKAVNVALASDFGTNNAVVQIADGTYQGTVRLNSTASTATWQAKSGFLILHGNDASPTSVILTNADTNHLFVAANGSRAIVESMYFTSTNRNNECLLDSQFFSYLGFSNVVFGACGANEAQLVAEANGTLEALGPYIVSGGGLAHAEALGNGTIYLEKPITFTNSPAFTYSVLRAYNGGSIFYNATTNGGIVTGPKYGLATSGSISSYYIGTPDTRIPGSSPGFQDISLVENTTGAASAPTLVFTNTSGTNQMLDIINGWHFGADNAPPGLSFFKSRGATPGSHGGLIAGDKILFMGAGGSDGTGWNTNKAAISINAADTWSSSSTPTEILFQTTPQGSTTRGSVLQLNTNQTISTFGFNQLALGSISVTSSPFTYTVIGGHSEFVFIIGGTITIITVNGTAMSAASIAGLETIPLQPGESVTVTYSSAPTMKRKPY